MNGFSLTTKKLSLGLTAILMISAGQVAFAHTTISNPINSGATGYSNLVIGHGCTGNATPIVAESVVWPVTNPHIAVATTAGTAVSTSGIAKYADFTNVATIAGLPQLVQSHDVFTQQIEQNDAPGSGGNVIGWVSTRGNLGYHLHGLIPFRFGSIKFQPATAPTTAAKCVSAVKIQAAVADICNINGFNSSTPTQPGVNLWLDNTQVGFYGATIENGAGTPVLTINRDPVADPYPANCAAAGGTDSSLVVTVRPSQEDVNKLVFPGWGGKHLVDPTVFY